MEDSGRIDQLEKLFCHLAVDGGEVDNNTVDNPSYRSRKRIIVYVSPKPRGPSDWERERSCIQKFYIHLYPEYIIEIRIQSWRTIINDVLQLDSRDLVILSGTGYGKRTTEKLRAVMGERLISSPGEINGTLEFIPMDRTSLIKNRIRSRIRPRKRNMEISQIYYVLQLRGNK